jgi:hypothetical protein
MKRLLTILCIPAVLLLGAAEGWAAELSPYKDTCKEIGFTPGTEGFGSCVILMLNRAKAEQEKQRPGFDMDAALPWFCASAILG